MNINDLKITQLDLKYILENKIIENIYTHYMGDGNSEPNNVQLIKNNYIMILKGFFCPLTIVKYAINDTKFETPDINNINLFTSLEKVLTEMKRFINVQEKDFYTAIKHFGYGRRFEEVLVKNFNIHKAVLLNALFLICKVNNDNL